MRTEWGIRSIGGGVFTCRDEEHAHAMMRSTSPVIGPMEGREVVSRQVSPWKTRTENDADFEEHMEAAGYSEGMKAHARATRRT